MSIISSGMTLVPLLFSIIFIGPIVSKPLQAKGFDREMLDENRSLSFTLRWKKLRIAEMLFSIAGEDEEHWEISGRTLGPLRLVKNYEGEAKQSYDTDIQKYMLVGSDQGFLENREILFRSGDLPSVRVFVDRTAETPLTPVLPWGKVAISPMGLFRRIMNSARSPSLCSGSMVVYDGKRAYTVKMSGGRAQDRDLRVLDLSEFTERIFWKCSATLDSSTLIQSSRELDPESKEMLKEFGAGEQFDNDSSTELRWSKVWLFGSKDRRVDFILSDDCAAFELVGLLLSSPLGRIIGKPPSTCEVRN
jgi:hypothetical protein